MQSNQIKVINKIQTQQSTQPTLQPKQPFTFKTWKADQNPEQSILNRATLCTGQLHQNLQKIILTMRVGQIFHLSVQKPQYNQPKQIHIEIVSADEIIDDIEFNAFAKAQKLKLQGNALLKQKKYAEAIQKYDESYSLIEYNCQGKAVQLKLSIMSNLALANLNSNFAEKCLNWCTKYIEQSYEQNKKIIYRKISAYKNMKSWTQAKKLLQLAKRNWINEAQTLADFQKLGEQIAKEQKIQKEKEKKIYNNMFG